MIATNPPLDAPSLGVGASDARPVRVLVVDDNASILETFQKILSPIRAAPGSYERLKAKLLGATQTPEPDRVAFHLDSAMNGETGCHLASRARASGWPYAVAFVDMRMPGRDGLATIEAMWRADPNVQIVICTAYSEYAWDEVVCRLGYSDRWLVLKKPFDVIEVQQMAAALAVKWRLQQKQRVHVDQLEQQIEARVVDLSRANRTLRIISRCHDALIRSRDEPELLDVVCQRLAEDGDYALAWIGFAQHDDEKSILPVAYAGINDGYLDALQLSWANIERGRGPSGRAIREARPAISRFLDTDPHFSLWRNDALQRGFASAVALPLCAKGETLGNLSIYSKTPDAFDDQEVTLLQELADDVAYGIANLRQAQARERAERELEYQVNYDVLTKLPNRSLFCDRLQQAIARVVRTKRQVATLVLILDRFQAIRDAIGEDAGDDLLRTMGERLSASVRAGDSVAHLTGEEFAIAITDLDSSDDVTGIVCKLIHAVAQPVRLGERESLLTTASIGISLSSTEGTVVEMLLRNATSAAHSASMEGGNTFHFYSPQMNERAIARLALEADLHCAIAAGELELHFQPKVNLRNGELVGAESLLRWRHARLGLVMPADFIPQAEESGLIVSMGEWVIGAVCEQIRKWIDGGIPVSPIAVNVSARQFRQKNLAAVLQQAMTENKIAPALIELEITESALMKDLDAAAAILQELKEIGVKLTLDDFGTGYSSMSYLQRFPVDQVKLDQTFVRNVTINPSDAAICKSVIDLAHALQLQVVGEGVENEGQLNYLRNHHCDQVQGYYFSKPLPVGEYGDLLRRSQPFILPDAGVAHERTLLIVDDEPDVLAALRRTFRCEGLKILTACNARDGLQLLAEHPVQVVLSDQRMPHMTGTDFLERVSAIYPDTIRIVLSGYAELHTVVDAINRGTLFKFLTKPWDDDGLRAQVRDAFVFHELRRGK